jgi:enoyl-CoA hydratase/carnithine racemase
MRGAIEALADLAVPTIAAVDGACYGAGVALALACDRRIAGRGARFAITPAKIGIAYPQEDVFRLVALVGRGQAARLLFTAEAIDADEAAAIGLVELVEPEGGAAAVAAAIAAHGGDSLALLKRGVGLAADGRRSDPEQDRRFDALIAGDALARRLEALGRK